jgi:hypothetical protein
MVLSYGKVYIRSNILFKWGVIHKVGNGRITQFWNDIWIDSAQLRICYHILFAICGDKNISVAECTKTNW